MSCSCTGSFNCLITYGGFSKIMNPEFIDLLESNLEHAENDNEVFDHVQESQEPGAVTVCCSDSRVLQDHMWGNSQPGEVFTVSNIGNRVFQKPENKVVSGDVLYPVVHTGTKTVVVVGHTGCGAVTATFKDVKEGIDELEGISHCIDHLKPLIKEGVKELPEGLTESEKINHLVEYNVDRQVEHLIESENIPEDSDIIGAVYDFQDVYSDTRGKVHVINVNGEREESNIDEEVRERVNRLWSY